MSDSAWAGEAWKTTKGGSGLYREFTRADETGHLALFYRSREERVDTAVTFLKAGLETNERCLYTSGGRLSASRLRKPVLSRPR